MKACPYCSEQIQDSASKCRYCGEWLNGESAETQVSEGFGDNELEALIAARRDALSTVVARPTPRTNPHAIASLILGLVGMGVGHILALVFGYSAMKQIDASGGQEGGRGLAVAGVILGWIGVAAFVLILLLAIVGGEPASQKFTRVG